MTAAALLAGDNWLWLVIIVLYALFSLGGAITTAIRRGRARHEVQALETPSRTQVPTVRRVTASSARPVPEAVVDVTAQRGAPPRRRWLPDQATVPRRREPARTLARDIQAGKNLSAAMIAGVIMGPPAAYRPGGHEPMDW